MSEAGADKYKEEQWLAGDFARPVHRSKGR